MTNLKRWSEILSVSVTLCHLTYVDRTAYSTITALPAQETLSGRREAAFDFAEHGEVGLGYFKGTGTLRLGGGAGPQHITGMGL